MNEIRDLLNKITLREHERWLEACGENDVISILQSVTSVKLCAEIAQELNINIIQPIGWEHYEEHKNGLA